MAFGIEYEREGRLGPITWSANVLSHIPDDGVPFAAKPGTHTLKNLARLGIVAVDGSWARPTSVGRAMRDAYVPLCARIEAGWRSRSRSSTGRGASSSC